MARSVDEQVLRSMSPFRYPGGKGFLSNFLVAQIDARFGSERPKYAEPFCGGAGAAINLLLSNRVEHLYLNDADHRVYSAWRAMIDEPRRFLDRLSKVKVDIPTWNKSLRIIHDSTKRTYDFNLGFATFFVNRTSRSGVIMGAGPIGGYSQEGKWKIDARFNKDTLRHRIREIAKRSQHITLSCLDGLEFCKSLQSELQASKVLFFIDPPYVQAGSRLYYDGMDTNKHAELARWLKKADPLHWVVTYDNHPSVRRNFEGLSLSKIDVRYSLGKRRLEKELLYMSAVHAA